MKSLILILTLMAVSTACQPQKSANDKNTLESNVRTNSSEKTRYETPPSSGRAYYRFVDPITKLETNMIYDGEDSEGAKLCQHFLNELEEGKTDFIESISQSETEKHQVLRGCARQNKTGNGLMLVARSSQSVSRKLEIFKLLIEKYKFPIGLASHANSYEEGSSARVDSYSVLNVVSESDDLLPLTEYLISKGALNTHISYPFGYNNGPEGDWCKTPLVAATILRPFLNSSQPFYHPRETLQIKTFKLLLEKKYTYSWEQMHIWDCTGQHRYESVLSFLERLKADKYVKMENLDEAIQICKTK